MPASNTCLSAWNLSTSRFFLEGKSGSDRNAISCFLIASRAFRARQIRPGRRLATCQNVVVIFLVAGVGFGHGLIRPDNVCGYHSHGHSRI